MTRTGLAAAFVLLPVGVLAQAPITIETIPLPSQDQEQVLPQDDDPVFNQDQDPVIQSRPNPRFQQEAAEPGERASGAVLRALDKVSGQTTDIELTTGQSGQAFALEVGLSECRYPAGNPAGDAYAYLVIRDPSQEGALFSGWMVASSPALSALDHARYDVWVLRCIIS